MKYVSVLEKILFWFYLVFVIIFFIYVIARFLI